MTIEYKPKIRDIPVAPFGGEKRRIFYVLHPEGTGGYMLTEALVAAGCHWKQWHESHHHDYKFEEMESPFVFHRSVPHAGLWRSYWKPRPLEQMSKAFDEVTVVTIVRDPHAAAMSVARRSDRHYEICSSNLRAAISQATNPTQDGLAFDYILVTYEAFCLSEGFRRWLFEERLQLPYPEDFEIKYGNSKYYEGEK